MTTTDSIMKELIKQGAIVTPADDEPNAFDIVFPDESHPWSLDPDRTTRNWTPSS